MLQAQRHLSISPFHLHNLPCIPRIPPPPNFLVKTMGTFRSVVSANGRSRPDYPAFLAQIEDTESRASPIPAPQEEEGPIELPPSTPSIFATSDDPSPLQVTTSVLLTGSITVLLFRSFRRRAKRAKERRLASATEVKTVKDEAIEALKAMTPTSPKSSSPSPVQALLGGITAGVIALILYKFTTTIEAALNRQTISDNFSVRQVTITIRTIVNGLCYLATFVFGINSLGLFLYSGQLLFNFQEGRDTSQETESKNDVQVDTPAQKEKPPTNNSGK